MGFQGTFRVDKNTSSLFNLAGAFSLSSLTSTFSLSNLTLWVFLD